MVTLADLLVGVTDQEEKNLRECMSEMETLLNNRAGFDIPAKMTVALNFAVAYMAINGMHDIEIRAAFETCMRMNPALSMRTVSPAGNA